MKQSKLILILLAFCVFTTIESSSQSCSGGSSYGSCYASVASGSYYETGGFIMNCPTGHASYYVQASSDPGGFGNAHVWGDFPDLQVSSTNGQGFVQQTNNLSGLNPAISYNVDVDIYGWGPSFAYLSVSTW